MDIGKINVEEARREGEKIFLKVEREFDEKRIQILWKINKSNIFKLNEEKAALLKLSQKFNILLE